MWAASARCLQTVEVVLDTCPKETASEGKDRNGSTALHFAAFQGALPVVQLLLDRGYSLKVRFHTFLPLYTVGPFKIMCFVFS